MPTKLNAEPTTSILSSRLYIGTSGYSYPHWRNIFYPPNLQQNQWLEFYSQHFNSVELNITFYRLLPKKTFQNWYKKTPPNFNFVVKGSRFITHIKRLDDCSEHLKTFFESASGLAEKLGCVLWQLPPSFKCDLKRLEKFIKILAQNYSWCRQSFEFRQKSWFNEQTICCLKTYDINLCIADSPRFPAAEEVVSSFIYLRFHGGRVLYGSDYSNEELSSWAKRISPWLREKTLLMAFFNNDAGGFAVKNARNFRELLEATLKNEKL